MAKVFGAAFCVCLRFQGMPPILFISRFFYRAVPLRHLAMVVRMLAVVMVL